MLLTPQKNSPHAHQSRELTRRRAPFVGIARRIARTSFVFTRSHARRMSRRLLKNQLSRALDALASPSGGGVAKAHAGTTKTKRAKGARPVTKNNKHALDAKRASKQAVRARQRAMRAAGDVFKDELTAERRAAVKRRNVGYYAMTGVAVDEHGEAAAKAIGVDPGNAGANGDDDDGEEMLW
jgi:hypothetical protein